MLVIPVYAVIKGHSRCIVVPSILVCVCSIRLHPRDGFLLFQISNTLNNTADQNNCTLSILRCVSLNMFFKKELSYCCLYFTCRSIIKPSLRMVRAIPIKFIHTYECIKGSSCLKEFWSKLKIHSLGIYCVETWVTVEITSTGGRRPSS